MNEMYDMSIVAHNYGVVGILLVVFINFIMLQRAKEINAYKHQMRVFTPIGSMAIGFIIFTGVIMMAAKHLDFSIENIVMIIFALVIIILEVKRAKTLKYSLSATENALEEFKSFAIKIFMMEIVVTLSISSWMWM